jgi:hypothetical protein
MPRINNGNMCSHVALFVWDTAHQFLQGVKNCSCNEYTAPVCGRPRSHNCITGKRNCTYAFYHSKSRDYDEYHICTICHYIKNYNFPTGFSKFPTPLRKLYAMNHDFAENKRNQKLYLESKWYMEKYWVNYQTFRKWLYNILENLK